MKSTRKLRFLRPDPQPPFASTALLVLRVVVGVAFMFHGWGKIQHPYNWMGPQAAFPGELQFLSALSEFGGGLAWILGLLTPIASFGVLCNMSVAVYTHLWMRGDPFVSSTGGTSYELALTFFAVALLLLAMGPGRYSLDAKLFRLRP